MTDEKTALPTVLQTASLPVWSVMQISAKQLVLRATVWAPL